MAFNQILRRASASVMPLARSVCSRSRKFHSGISAIIGGVEKQSLGGQQFAGRQLFVPFSRSFSYNADANLLNVLQSEIDCADEPANPSELIPDQFPFKIQDNPGERTVLLERTYQDETIKVEVDFPSNYGEDPEESGNEEAENEDEPGLPLVVSISKGSGQCLEFGVTAFQDEIQIDSLSIKNPESPEDQLAYEGPNFDDLDENLQKGFHKYLEIRGIKPSTTNFLFEYMKEKDLREYKQWLENLKNFVGK